MDPGFCQRSIFDTLSQFVRHYRVEVADKQLRARLAFEDRVGDGRDPLQIGPYHDPDQGLNPLPEVLRPPPRVLNAS